MTEMNTPPAVVELPFAPVMREMASGQAFIIDTFGVKPTVGVPLAVHDQYGRYIHKNTLPSVRVIIGEERDADYLEVTDISTSPWYDRGAKMLGNFALVHWTKGPDTKAKFEPVHCDYMRPGQLFVVGRTTDYGIRSLERFPPSVQDQHVTIGFRQKQGVQPEGLPPRHELFIRNHRHDGRTVVWDKAYGGNQDVPVTGLVRGVRLGDARHFGKAGGKDEKTAITR